MLSLLSADRCSIDMSSDLYDCSQWLSATVSMERKC